MKFIETGKGNLVNLNFVAKIIPQDHKWHEAELIGADGATLGTISHEPMAQFVSSVLPAVGVTAVVLTDIDGKIETSEVHVVGWRVHSYGLEAILLDEIASNEAVFIKQPDGVLVDPGISSYSNLDEAIESFRKDRAKARNQK